MCINDVHNYSYPNSPLRFLPSHTDLRTVYMTDFGQWGNSKYDASRGLKKCSFLGAYSAATGISSRSRWKGSREGGPGGYVGTLCHWSPGLASEATRCPSVPPTQTSQNSPDSHGLLRETVVFLGYCVLGVV